MRILSDIVSSDGAPVELKETSRSSMQQLYAMFDRLGDILEMDRAGSLLSPTALTGRLGYHPRGDLPQWIGIDPENIGVSSEWS